MQWWEWFLVGVGAFLALVATYDLIQRKHAVLKNFPIIGHLRYLLEGIGPEVRQYIIADNNADKPFSRDQRRWVYTSAKRVNTYFGFGTDNDVEGSPNYHIIKQVSFPLSEPVPSTVAPDDPAKVQWLPCAKVLGKARDRHDAFRMQSAVNISGMSYGSLSAAAVESLNRGAALAGCLQTTGEGGLTRHHRHGGELVWQIGTGYFGCRNDDGTFSIERFADVVAATPQLRAIEVKLSQGAKAGLGGVLPGAKVTKEIAEIRGIPVGIDCVSPAAHTAFHDADSLLDFVEQLATVSGRPVGIKSAVGDTSFFHDLAKLMTRRDRGVDFVTIDGGEGGTGAGPLAFSDHVGLPFKIGFSRVYRAFVEEGITDDVVFVGSGKLGFPDTALLAFALGCDAVNVGREAMLSIGCIQAQRCHTGRCPTGVTTNSKWLMRGLDPDLKCVRCAAYVTQLRHELLQISRACGRVHPALVTLDAIEVLDDRFGTRRGAEVFGYEPGWGVPSAADRLELEGLLAGTATV
jgi:glutamate synthase domain-containing protein 2